MWGSKGQVPVLVVALVAHTSAWLRAFAGGPGCWGAVPLGSAGLAKGVVGSWPAAWGQGMWCAHCGVPAPHTGGPALVPRHLVTLAPNPRGQGSPA